MKLCNNMDPGFMDMVCFSPIHTDELGEEGLSLPPSYHLPEHTIGRRALKELFVLPIFFPSQVMAVK